MTWSVDSGVQVQNLVTVIATRLTASGWTLTDRTADGVWQSTNNQGATNIIQITNCQNSGAAADSTHNQYLQFQGWLSWTAGSTHAGTSGSGTTYNRIYYAPINVAATATVDLYMSVTANRAFIYVAGQSTYRNWAYLGGLDSLAGTNDVGCVLLLTSYNYDSNIFSGAMLGSSNSSPWNYTSCGIPLTISNVDSGYNSTNNQNGSTPLFAGSINQILLAPILIYDSNATNYPTMLRGALDGIYYNSTATSPGAGHGDVVVANSTNHLIIVPGGNPTSAQVHAITGNYRNALAIAEV